MDYGLLIRKSWEIAWRNRILWLFGFLTGGAGSIGYLNPFQFMPHGGSPKPTPSPNNPYEITQNASPPFQLPPMELMLTIGIIVLAAILVAVIISSFISSWAQSSLVVGVMKRNEMTLSFKPLAQAGLQYWWKILLLNSTFAVGILGVLLVLLLPVIPLLLLHNNVALITYAVVSITIFFVFILVAGTVGMVILQIAQRLLIHRGGKTFSLLRQSYDLIKKYKGKAFLTWLVAYGLQFVFGIGMLLGLLPVVGLVVFLFVINIYIGIGALLPALAIVFIASGLVQTFTVVYWTLFYEHLAAQEGWPAWYNFNDD